METTVTGDAAETLHRIQFEVRGSKLVKGAMMTNSYSPADVAEIGEASELILGSSKGIFFDDGPGQDKRTIIRDQQDSDG